MISLKQLNYALAIEKTMHFKKAAELCNISQSALSTALNELEKQLDLQIFERNNKKVLLTPAGKEVLQRAQAVMLQVDDIEQLAKSQKTPLSFPMSIGVIPTIAPYLLPKMFPLLKTTYPNAQISLLEEQSHVLLEKVHSGEIDSAIIALPYDCEGLLSLEFWQEDFYWIALKGNRYSYLPAISGTELANGELMLLREGHCLKDQILDVCKLSENTSKASLGATSLNTLVQMVRGNLGTTLVPAMALEALVDEDPNLTKVALKETGPHRRIAFIFRPNYSRFSSIEALAKVCTQALS